MENKRQTIERIKDSLELSVIKRDVILYTLVIGIVILLASGDVTFGEDGTMWTTLVIFTGIFLLPIWGFYLWRTICIFRKAEHYTFCRCTLSQPHQNYYLKMMYFTVVIELPDGSKTVRNTHAIFACHGFVEPLMENYVNSTVTIGYNEETDMVVVIG